ncbi:MAG: hypothetical protein KDK26_10455 [Roseivivax sp.]|nr:hypothetical protein [Roseivivax sp.]
MTVQAAHLFATLCLGLVFFQVALVAGAPWGAYTQGGGTPGRLPPKGRLIAAASIPVLLAIAAAILSAAGFAGGFWPRWTGWAATAAIAGSAGLNAISQSEPERRLWAPVATIMAALAGYVMIASR